MEYPDPNVWAGYGERSLDDMVQLWLDLVDMDDAQFKEAVAERKAKFADTDKEAWILPMLPVTPQATLVASARSK